MNGRRNTNRLAHYDYATIGAYFITVCVQYRRCLFGEVIDEEMQVNKFGEMVEACWHKIPVHFKEVSVDEFVVMPNHIHGILFINDRIGDMNNIVGARHALPLRKVSLGTIVGSFKSATTKSINELRGAASEKLWQRNYYEHVIRNDEGLNRVREYILLNPLKWNLDKENPINN